jgi:Transposase
VAIETTNGVVVDRLLAAGHPVIPVHPNAFNATRPRWGAARAKSDPGDSWKLADLLRTDGHRLHRLRPLGAATLNLQVLSRLRDHHLEAKTAATNQLGALLDAHWPGAKAIFARLDSPIALAFLERYPTPQAAERLGEGRLAAFCRRHAYSGHRTPAALLTRLRAAPVAVNSLDPKVLAACVGAQVQLLRALLAAICRELAFGDLPVEGHWANAESLCGLSHAVGQAIFGFVADVGWRYRPGRRRARISMHLRSPISMHRPRGRGHVP